MELWGRDERRGGEVVGNKEVAAHGFKDPTPFYGAWASFCGHEGVIRDVF